MDIKWILWKPEKKAEQTNGYFKKKLWKMFFVFYILLYPTFGGMF